MRTRSVVAFTLTLVAVGCSSGNPEPPQVDHDVGTITEDSAPTDSGGATDSDGTSFDTGTETADAVTDAASDETCAPFHASGDVITDSRTSLHWQRHIQSLQSWSQAVATCKAWGGRLPTKDELLAIVDPAIACAKDGKMNWDGPPSGDSVWSSTQDPASAGFYYTVYFHSGTMPISTPMGDSHWVRCVK